MLRNRMLRSAGAAGGEEIISVLAVNSSGDFLAYKFSKESGWLSAYAAPASAPISYVYGLAASPNGEFVVIGQDVYEWDKVSGFGSKYAAPSTPVSGAPIAGGNPAVHDLGGGNYLIAFLTQTSPYVWVYPFNASTGFGIKFADPDSYSATSLIGVDFSPGTSPTRILLSHYSPPALSVYPWSFDFADPYPGAPNSVGNSFNPKWSRAGNHILYQTNNDVRSIAWAGTSYGSASGLADVPSSGRQVFCLSNSGDTVFGANFNAPGVLAYPYDDSDGTFGAAYSNPASGSVSDSDSVAVSPNDDVVFIVHDSGDFISAWGFEEGVGWGEFYGSPPASLPSAGFASSLVAF